MTVHKLSAGNGYTYLTKHTASADTVRAAGQSLADYYLQTGNPPGRWVGRGARDLGVSGPVTEDQMRSLFGRGMHPDAAVTGARLGRPFPTYRDGRTAVAGYDLVFSPVKSVSLLWALGDEHTRRQVHLAHREAIDNTLGWLQDNAAFSRIGRGGHTQVPVRGLICAVFDHHDSRAGDPDLHTHVAVSNKVRARDDHPGGQPRWLALDGQALFHAGVAASERYNTRVEDALARRLGVHFTPRRVGVAGKRVIREVDGIPDELIRGFSKRRQAIEEQLEHLVRDYRTRHGRGPGTAASLKLAQQATLDTRPGKPVPRSVGDRVTSWRSEAAAMIGDELLSALAETVTNRPIAPTHLDAVDLESACGTVLDALDERRATWTRWHLVAEIERQTRPLRLGSAQDRDRLTLSLTEYVQASPSTVLISNQVGSVPDPAARRDMDTSRPAASLFTTRRVLDAEQRLLVAATPTSARLRPVHGVSQLQATRLLDHHASRARQDLDAGQRDLAIAFATDPRPLLAGIGPAGSGKTTAMAAACAIWDYAGTRVIPLATSAASAAVLGAELGRRAENLHKFLHELDNTCTQDPDFYRLRSGDTVLVDEAGMAGTLNLDRLQSHAAAAGARVRLLGDPAQLPAVEAGGVLRLLSLATPAVSLTTLHRFADPDEAAATLRLRDGDPAALEFYLQRDRVRTGDRTCMADDVYRAWHRDHVGGVDSVMITTANREAAALCRRTQTDRLSSGHIQTPDIQLADGTLAGVGDWIITRQNNRDLRILGGRDFVKNGDPWVIQDKHPDGSITAARKRGGGTVSLPAPYVEQHVQLGYALTAHLAQGTTTDTAHLMLSTTDTREQLYVGISRGRHRNHIYLMTDEVDQSPRGALRQVLARSSEKPPATQHSYRPGWLPTPSPTPPRFLLSD